MLYIAIGIIGATVMPHNLYLHSSIVQTRAYDRSDEGRRAAIKCATADSTIALMGGAGSITAVFSVPPFQFQQLQQAGIHTVLSSFDVVGPHTFSVAWTTSRFHKDNPELYGAFLDAVKEATGIIVADPKAAAASWIKDSNSKLDPGVVAGIIGGKDVTWTQTPQANMTFAKFMHQVGSIKASPESWKDLYFSEIHDLPGN